MHTVIKKSTSITSNRAINHKEKANIALEEVLHKYKLEMEKQELDMLKEHRQQEDKIRNTIQKKREESINMIKENKEFLKEWEHKGRQKWASNINIFETTKRKDAEFKSSTVQKYKDYLLTQKKYRETDEIEGIKAFERNLERLGIDINNRKEEGDKKKKEQFSIVALMRKIKEKVNNNKQARKEMERRKNKQSVNEENMQKELEKKQKKRNVFKDLLKYVTTSKNYAIMNKETQNAKKLMKPIGKAY